MKQNADYRGPVFPELRPSQECKQRLIDIVITALIVVAIAGVLLTI